MLRLLAPLALLLVPGGPPWRHLRPEASDGEPQFGPHPELQSTLGMFRLAREEEIDFLGRLLALEPETRLYFELARSNYRARGFFDVLPRTEDGLPALHEAWRTFETTALDRERSREDALCWARMWFDARFRLRVRLFDTYQVEARELRGAIALLIAGARGTANLRSGDELERITSRANLAATRLAALRSDLALLCEPAFLPAEVQDPEEVCELALLLEQWSGSAGREELARARLDVARRESELVRISATDRLDHALAPELARRASDLERAEVLYRETAELLPFTSSGAHARPEIAQMPFAERHRQAQETAREGLALDPFHPGLNYLLGEATDFLQGQDLSRIWFERYLALHGIRYYDIATLLDRDFTAMEERALERVSGEELLRWIRR